MAALVRAERHTRPPPLSGGFNSFRVQGLGFRVQGSEFRVSLGQVSNSTGFHPPLYPKVPPKCGFKMV